jgi:hypothetical protein
MSGELARWLVLGLGYSPEYVLYCILYAASAELRPSGVCTHRSLKGGCCCHSTHVACHMLHVMPHAAVLQALG